MNQQPLVKETFMGNNLYHFGEYKKKKPFFKGSIKISIDSPFDTTYYMVHNVVFKGKQILALKHEEESKTIFLVVANIENGQLKAISRLPDEYLGEVAQIMDGAIQ